MQRRVNRFFAKQARQLRRKAALPAAYLRSRHRARREGNRLDEVEAFCLFVGYPRSGHSLVGSLLDAHPDAAIAHELHILRYLRYGFRREHLLSLVLENSERAAATGREQTGYRYGVPGQWQGRVRRFRIAGDKRGGTAIRKIARSPGRLAKLERILRVPLRYVHVVRNPFDSIARMALASPHRTLEELTAHYFRMAAGVAELWRRVGDTARVEIQHELLIARPESELKRVCESLGLTAEPAYLAACARVVWPKPQRTRARIDWPQPLRASIRRSLTRYPFFSHYDFDS